MDKDELVRVIAEIVKKEIASSKKLMVPVQISARHVHLSRQDMDVLFGEGKELTKKKDLMGGQFAAEECVTILGGKLNSIENVRVLGPLRSKTQVEVSKTDGIKLGTKIPSKDSGDLSGTAPVTIVGPNGVVKLNEGCIVALRHIHMSPGDAEKYGLKDKQMISVKIPGSRGGVFTNVKVRVDKTYSLEMHIDTDEANALDIRGGSLLEAEI